MATRQAVSKDRHDRRRSKTRAAILAAAAEVFHEKGVDVATVTEIAERADVAYGSFYNHFKTMDEVIASLAAASVQVILDRTRSILEEVKDYRLLPGVGARIIMRSFLDDAVVRWMLNRPYVFAPTFLSVARPFMVAVEKPGIDQGIWKPAAGHEAWMRTMPWVLLSELNEAITDGDASAHEEAYAKICMRLLGVDDDEAENLLATSLKLVEQHGF